MMTGLCVLRAGNQRFSQHRRSHVRLFTFLIVQNHGCLLGRFSVLANSEQNSTGKFPPGIVFTIGTNQFHFSKKRPRKPETGFKDGVEEMEH